MSFNFPVVYPPLTARPLIKRQDEGRVLVRPLIRPCRPTRYNGSRRGAKQGPGPIPGVDYCHPRGRKLIALAAIMVTHRATLSHWPRLPASVLPGFLPDFVKCPGVHTHARGYVCDGWAIAFFSFFPFIIRFRSFFFCFSLLCRVMGVGRTRRGRERRRRPRRVISAFLPSKLALRT